MPIVLHLSARWKEEVSIDSESLGVFKELNKTNVIEPVGFTHFKEPVYKNIPFPFDVPIYHPTKQVLDRVQALQHIDTRSHNPHVYSQVFTIYDGDQGPLSKVSGIVVSRDNPQVKEPQIFVAQSDHGQITKVAMENPAYIAKGGENVTFLTYLLQEKMTGEFSTFAMILTPYYAGSPLKMPEEEDVEAILRVTQPTFYKNTADENPKIQLNPYLRLE